MTYSLFFGPFSSSFLELDRFWLMNEVFMTVHNHKLFYTTFAQNSLQTSEKKENAISWEAVSIDTRDNTSINWPNLSVNQYYWCIIAARAQKAAHSSHLFMVYSLLPVMKLECCSGISHYSSQMVFDLQGFTGFFFSLFCFLKRLLSFLFSIEGWSYASEIQLKMHESSDPDSMHFSPIPFLFERPLP